MIAYPVHVEDAMLIVPLNLPSLPVPAVPPQTASSSPSTTGNTRRDGLNGRFNMSLLPRSLGAFSTAAPAAPCRPASGPCYRTPVSSGEGVAPSARSRVLGGLLTCHSAVRAKVSGQV